MTPQNQQQQQQQQQQQKQEGARERNKRAITSLTVRFDDKQGFKCRFNKTGFNSPVRKSLFSFYFKRYELVRRGESECAALKKFEMFRSVSEKFPALKPLPVDFGRLEEPAKKSTLMALVEEQLEEAARIFELDQGVDIQANHPDDMQEDEGSVADSGLEGIVNTVHPVDGYSLQNVVPGSVLIEGSPSVPPGFPLHNPGGRPSPSSGQHPDELNHSMMEIERRASRFPDISGEFETLKQHFLIIVNKVKDREVNEPFCADPRSTLSRTSLAEIPSQLPEGIPAEDPQNQRSKASMEDVGYQASYSQPSDFGQYGVKNMVTTMPGGEQDALVGNRSISKVLEDVPRYTGRLKSNIAEIRPQVCVDDMDRELQYQIKSSTESLNPLASHLQVSVFCSGGENFTTLPNSGGNNTSQSDATDCFASTELSAFERWAEEQLDQFEILPRESSPRRPPWPYFSSDTLPT